MIVTSNIPIEEQKQWTLNKVDKVTIHLGIPTNIICIDDRLKPKHLNIDKKTKTINDFTATLYLGKIIFKKNKYGNLAPIYTPSQITESSFDGLNTFWLNEINPRPKTPFRSMIQCEDEELLELKRYNGDLGYLEGLDLLECKPDKKSIPYQKIHYYRTKDNITLNKDQIISYFTELHTLNTTFIKNYIDSINNNNGIKANILHDTLYDELLEKGILHKDMFEWYRDGKKRAYSQAKLLALDYFKKTHQSNFTIVFFDELFYAYFIVSLKDFILAYYDKYKSNEYVNTNKLIFNTGAYRKYYNMSSSNGKPKPYFYKNNEQIYGNEVNLFMPNESRISNYIDGFDFKSPNRIYRTYPATGKPIYDDKEPPIYAPSPLGNYYFELTDNIGTFIEFFQRIYPSIDNPPKGWNKEMMKKLELKLE